MLERMRGKQEEERGDPLTRTIRDRYQATLAGTLHSLIFLHVTTDSGLDTSAHIDLAQRCQEDALFQKYLKGSKSMVPQVPAVSWQDELMVLRLET